MATDARVRYTKMVIVQSFIKLLKDKPINRITVKEICELSEINRATFYKHYLDVYDLLDKIEAQYLDELMEVLKSPINNTPKTDIVCRRSKASTGNRRTADCGFASVALYTS